MDLRDRVVVVTGGAVHLGHAFSTHLAAEGARVVVADVADTSMTVKHIREEGGEAHGVTVDLLDESSVTALARGAIETFGHVDAVVNNAGYFRAAFRGPVEDIPTEEWDRCFDVNVRGTWWVIRAFVDHFKARRYGKVVNVSSATAYKGVGNMAHYVSAKAAVAGLTRALAVELGPHGICINTLAPDAVLDPQMLDDRPEVLERVLGQRAIKRPMTPDDLVGTVAYLCGPGSDFVTGQTFHVNGGTFLS
ncbi:MAG TPA: SDR family oxidoreductase [Actinomycetales bacterium]|jgi:3-oxoacyl-[acyl-carrier protein] reductase|nr:SDR family oxidoreductase [Actinomycetales bacterium]